MLCFMLFDFISPYFILCCVILHYVMFCHVVILIYFISPYFILCFVILIYFCSCYFILL